MLAVTGLNPHDALIDGHEKRLGWVTGRRCGARAAGVHGCLGRGVEEDNVLQAALGILIAKHGGDLQQQAPAAARLRYMD
jgi:hypothetical protein